MYLNQAEAEGWQSTLIFSPEKRQSSSTSWLQMRILPIPKRQILNASRLKEFADDNFKADEIGRKFSKWVENNVGKGGIARCQKLKYILGSVENIVGKGNNVRYQHFLLFPGLISKGFLFNPFQNKPWFLRVCNTSLENTARKGEIVRNEQFLLFPQCFLPFWMTTCHFHQI